MTSEKEMEQFSYDCWKPAVLFISLSVGIVLLLHVSGDLSVPGLPLATNYTSLVEQLTFSLQSSSLPMEPHPMAMNISRPDPSVQELSQRKEEKKVDKRIEVEKELDRARRAIRESSMKNDSDVNGSTWFDGKENRVNIYRNRAAFFQSYEEMEKRFKVYVYEEGEPPLMHRGPCKNIYSTEGRFIEGFEQMTPVSGPKEKGIRVRDPQKAHAFFLPISVTSIEKLVERIPNRFDREPFKRIIADYVNVIASKHPFWNRSVGADHFMLSCHDWAPDVSKGHRALQENSIHALCNANTSEGFKPYKDVSIPEINLVTGDIPIQFLEPPPPLASRNFLAFFAGGVHGPIRPILLQHWEGRDLNYLPVYNYLPQGLDYNSFMLHSRFCLCPSGYEVASPRIVEAIYAECIPVIISKSYALPFFDVLRWEAFSVSVSVEETPRLKELLEGISKEEVERLRDGVKEVKKHFVFHQPPEKFDAFHMILHSVWLRRLNVRVL